MSESYRQGMGLFFSIMMVWVGVYFLDMTYFETILLGALAHVVIKLKDIQEVIRDK